MPVAAMHNQEPAFHTLTEAERQQEALRRVEGYLYETAKPRVTYGPNGAVVGVEETDGRQSVYTYSDWGDLIGIREPDGRETRYEYEARRLTRVVFPDGGETRYEYDANGHLSTMSERGFVTRYAYDAQGRWTQSVCADGTTTDYMYDAQGRVIRAVATPPASPETQTQTDVCQLPVTMEYEHDAQGQITAIHQEINGVRVSVRLRFDASGRLSELNLPGLPAPLRYTWDKTGRPQTVSLNTESSPVPCSLSPVPLPLAQFEFDDATRTTRVHLANGWVEETRADSIDCRPVSRRVWHTERTNETLLSRHNTYDAQGRIIADGARCYDYDVAGRLCAVHAVQEETSRAYAYDSGDCLLRDNAPADTGDLRDSNPADADVLPVHDARGRQTRRTDACGTWTYAYDDAHNLRRVALNGQPVATFAYDHKGQLAASQIENRVERYLYGPADELLAVTDAAGNLIRADIRTPLGLLAQIDGAGDIFSRTTMTAPPASP